MRKNKVLIIAPQTDTFINFRGDLMEDIIKKNYDITVIVPESGFESYFEERGIKQRLVNLEKNSLSPMNSINYQKQLEKIIKEEKPDKVFSYTSKPVIFGSIAAGRCNVKEIYSLVCGLGSVYATNTLKNKIVRSVMGLLYRKAFKYNKKVIFQNSDDIDEFVKRKYLKKEKCELVNGSGVNLRKFIRNELPKENSFIMVSRIIKEKGVAEYFEAAKIIKEKYPDTKFTYIGQYDKSYQKDFEKIKEYIDSGIVEYIPTTNDVPQYIAKAKVFVLPSYYREGIPRTLLEATAMGRPIITTKMPGCKETVVEYKNGLFTQIKSSEDLADKMEWMIKNEDKLKQMSDESYNICLNKFTIEIINENMLSIMGVK